MTPPPLDPGALHARLRHMRELLDDLDGVGSVSSRQLDADRMLRHAVERILTQLVDLAVSVNGHICAAELGRIPTDYRDSFLLVAESGAIHHDLASRLAPSTGLRNVLTHEYVAIDLDVVAASVELARTAYAEFVREVARWLERRTADQ